jgi:hypothetical protein
VSRRGAARDPNHGSIAGQGVGAAASSAAGFVATVSAADAIAGIPDSLREELLARFNDVVRNYRNQHWESAILNAGKFAEVVYTILRGRADGAYPARGAKPRNMVEACRVLESVDETRMGGHGMRITIPRAIPPIYDIRNNRGVGHAGAEIDPAHMDAEYALHTCQWILAELVRVYHRLPPKKARAVVEALIEREIPLIWEVGGVKRILDPALAAPERVLVLLYSSAGAVDEDELLRWTEYANGSRFRKVILPDLHARALIHYNRGDRTVEISPLGQRRVEREIITTSVLAA